MGESREKSQITIALNRRQRALVIFCLDEYSMHCRQQADACLSAAEKVGGVKMAKALREIAKSWNAQIEEISEIKESLNTAKRELYLQRYRQRCKTTNTAIAQREDEKNQRKDQGFV